MQLNLTDKRLDLSFYFCLFSTIAMPAIFPHIRLMFFAPFLVLACYQKSFKTCMWLAFFCGICMDLLSSYTRIGLYSLDYCIALAVVYTQRRNFFADSLSTLPLMTGLFTSLSTLIMALLLYMIEMKNVFSFRWMMTDLVFMPASDALFAFVFFILPAQLFGKPQRKGKDYFLSR